jgi:hypothetical protein
MRLSAPSASSMQLPEARDHNGFGVSASRTVSLPTDANTGRSPLGTVRSDHLKEMLAEIGKHAAVLALKDNDTGPGTYPVNMEINIVGVPANGRDACRNSAFDEDGKQFMTAIRARDGS